MPARVMAFNCKHQHRSHVTRSQLEVHRSGQDELHGALHHMHSRLNLDVHLRSTLQHNSSRRAFAARLDMTIKRAKVTSGRVARSLGVPEHEVTLWRAGVTRCEECGL